MKILIYMIRWEGGVGRVISSVKKELEKKGYEVKVISREDDLKLYSTIKSYSNIKKIIKEEKYDILYSQDWSCALPLLNFKNHFCCFHGIEQSGIAKYLQKAIGYRLKDKLFVVGDKLKKRFKKSNLSYNGYDPEEFYDLGNKRNKIGWVNKATEELDKSDIDKLADKFNLIPIIAKGIPPKEMNEWYNSLNTFISMPTKMAGFNLVWIEALAAGVPNVLGNENGIGISWLKENWKELTWENNVNKLLRVLKYE